MTTTILDPVGRGIVSMPFDEYLAHPSYGSSDLRTFRFGPPAMVPWCRANREDHTPATRVGEAAHCAILTPDLFAVTYALKPASMKFSTKEGKAWRDEQVAKGIAEDMILTDAEAAAVLEIQRAFHGKAAASESLQRAAAVERSIFWDDAYGLPCKGRPDWFDKRAVYDLKVSIDAEKGIGTVRRKAFTNGWLGQLAHNAAGLRANGQPVKVGRLVVIAPRPPQGIRVWLLEVSDNDLDVLTLENENTSRDMVECHRSGVWPGTPDDWQKCPLPADHLMADLDTSGAEEAPLT